MAMTRQLREQALEAREFNHRMMNMLAVLHANFRREFSQFHDQSVLVAVRQFEARIMAMCELFRATSATSEAAEAAVDVYLERLSHTLSRAILAPANVSCEIYSDPGWLPASVLERLGFAVIELILNASKYAFAGRSDGVIRVEMTQSNYYWLCTVSDNGIGMDSARRGTGLGIVDALVRSLDGRLTIRSSPSGTWACIAVPAFPRLSSEVSVVAENKASRKCDVA